MRATMTASLEACGSMVAAPLTLLGYVVLTSDEQVVLRFFQYSSVRKARIW